MSNKRLLRSWPTFEEPPRRISEAANVSKEKGRIVLTGILQKADTLNQNGRIYPCSVLSREVENYQKYILERRATGELDHPDSSVVSLKNASHNIIEAWMEGNVVYGRAMLLNTPSGRILQNLHEDGIKLGISSRGVGSTERDGDYYIVQDDFQLICWDFVSEPSTPGAFMLPEHAAFMPEGMEIKGEMTIAERVRESRAPVDTIDAIVSDLLSMRNR